MSPPNVILIVLDSARADAFGPATPNLWRLGEGGMRFSRAIAPAGWTLPSHVSMFTGLAPTEHQVVGLRGGAENVLRNARHHTRRLAERGDLLAPTLAARGIKTFSASASPWVTKASGLDVGFGTTDFFNFMQLPARTKGSKLPKRVRQATDTARSVIHHARWLRSRRDKGAERVLEGMVGFIRAQGEPFFAFTNLMETHEPHIPVAPSQRTLSNRANVVLQPGLVRLTRMHAHNWGTFQMPKRVIEMWKRAYAAEVDYVDGWLGRLVDALSSLRVLDNTVVIVTGDHGESFGEGGLVGHGISLRDSLAHVPLAMWGPGIEPRGTVTTTVSCSSIGPTIAHLMTASGAPQLLDRATHGRAHFEVEPPDHVAHPTPRAKRIAAGPGAAFYDGDMKLVVDPFAPTTDPVLFDLRRDPTEERSVGGEAEPTEWQLAELSAWRSRAEALFGHAQR